MLQSVGLGGAEVIEGESSVPEALGDGALGLEESYQHMQQGHDVVVCDLQVDGGIGGGVGGVVGRLREKLLHHRHLGGGEPLEADAMGDGLGLKTGVASKQVNQCFEDFAPALGIAGGNGGFHGGELWGL